MLRKETEAMECFYEIIINGNFLVRFDNKQRALQTLKEWKTEGLLKPTDNAVIRTTLVVEDEVNLWGD
jgi:hypothetical protein